jgi:hypothetical protein
MQHQQCNNFNQAASPVQHNQVRHVQETPSSIPIELLEEILRWGWFSLMSVQERIAFMTSVALVSKTWLTILIRISCRDVYIPSAPYLTHHREFTIRRSPIFHKLSPDVSPSQLCHTITRQIIIPVSAGETTRYARLLLFHFQRKSIQNMISMFRGLSSPMPNLRSLAVEYYPPTFGRRNSASIVQLHLEYTFASDCPRWLVDGLLASRHSRTTTSKHVPWALPFLEHVSTPVTEDPSTSIFKVLDRCPRLQIVEEKFTIRVHVLSSSRLVPENCVIFHGAMPSFDACVVDCDDLGSTMVRGSAPALVLTNDNDRVCEPSIDLSNMFRNVHVYSKACDII